MPRKVQLPESAFRALFENTFDQIHLFTLDGTIVAANSASCKILEYSKSELIGMNIADIEETMDIDTVKSSCQAVWDLGGLSVEGCQISKSGKRIPVEVNAAPYEHDNQKFILTIVRDISDRKRMEAQRQDFERMANHDLRNPVMLITGLPEEIRSFGNLTPVQERMLSLIEGAGDRILRLLDFSQRMSHMETKTYELTAQPFNIVTTIENVITELKNLADSKSITCTLSAGNQISAKRPIIPINGEEALVHTMFSNLLKNALEASPEEKCVEIDVYLSGSTVYTTIHNFGAIPESLHNTIFEKYTTHGKRGGMGLGAYSAFLIASTHGGHISFVTNPNSGTTFTVTLPQLCS